jgi:hypothetical protein
MTLNALSHQPALATQTPVDAGINGDAAGSAFYQPVDIHRALEEVRQMPEFQPPKPGWLEELGKQPWIKKLGHRVGDALQHIFKAVADAFSHVKPPGLSHLPENIRDIFSGVIGFVLVLMGLFALYVFLGWLLRLKEKKALPPPPQARLLEQVVLVSSAHHYRQAQLESGKGDFEAALRHLYMAALCLLDEQKVAPYEATRTNLEYETLLAKVADVAGGVQDNDERSLKDCFARLARQFEAVRYGMLPVSQQQLVHSQSDYENLQQLVGQQAGGEV